ncbi:MAG TPA: hypothetical protein ENJ67_00200 [Sulfurimonas autotrophica]|uniref:Uncharacterized protein n=1 Tax=Sulfurimonas autotrophica TaxID=202747 RepID=A0A7C3C9F8_9BACT|nr:hypothetical protein [Sulfurimonas autotrophica]
MLKLQKQLFRRIAAIYIAIFALFFLFTFFVLKLFLPLESLIYVLGSILVIFVILSLVFFLFLQLYLKNIEKDINAITQYTHDINEKEYTSEVKIMHYVEFLHLSVLLKNIAKRLYQKDKKAAKK